MTKSNSSQFLGFGNVAGCGQHPLAADEAQIDLAFAEGHQPLLVLAHHDGHDQATLNRPQADRTAILDEADYPIVVRLGGVGAEDWGDFAADLESVGNLGDGAYRVPYTRKIWRGGDAREFILLTPVGQSDSDTMSLLLEGYRR